MKKRMSFAGLCTLMCAALFLFSCSNQSGYMQLIPSDASFVVTFDMKSLSKKGDVANWIKSGKIESLSKALTSGMNGNSVKLLKEIQADPAASGISFTDNWVCFGFGDLELSVYMLAKVSDIDKLKNVLRTLEIEGAATPVSEDKNFQSTIIGNGTLCAFDENKVVLVANKGNATTEGLKKEIAPWFTQKKEKSLLANEEFNQFLKKNQDINYWCRIGAMPASMRNLYTAYLPDGVLIGSLYSIGYCDFLNGKMKVDSEMRSDDKDSAKKLEEIFKIMGKQSGKFLKQIPANAVYTIGLNLDGEKLYKLLLSMPGLSQNKSNMIQSEDTKKIIDSIDGDVLFSIIGTPAGMGFMGASMTEMALFARVNDDYAVELIKRNLGIFGVKEIGKNRYKLNMGGTTVYFGLEDKKNLFITNSNRVFENLSNGMPDSMTKAPCASAFDKSSYSVAIDVKESAGMLLPMIMGAYGSGQYASAIAGCPLTYMSLSGNGMQGNAEIYLSDDSKNALAVLLDWVNSLAAQAM